MKQGKYTLKVKFEGVKIVDNDFNDFESMEDMFKDVKRKFKGGR